MIQPHQSAVVATTTRLLQPWLWLFALYVLLHGHDSPGGGFQAGVILAAAVILEALAYGDHSPRYRVVRQRAVPLAALGVLLYAATGMAGLLGGNFLDYSRLPLQADAAALRRWTGILLVELGVCLGVMGSLVVIFDRLAPGRAVVNGGSD